MLCIFSSPSLVFHFINSHLSSENHSPLFSHFSLCLFCFSKPFAAICTPSLKFIFNFLSPSQFLPHLYCSLSLFLPQATFYFMPLLCLPLRAVGNSFFCNCRKSHTYILARAHTCIHACMHTYRLNK